jgi:hypothetical protein
MPKAFDGRGSVRGKLVTIVAAVAAVVAPLYLLVVGWADLLQATSNTRLFVAAGAPDAFPLPIEAALFGAGPVIVLGFLGAICYAGFRFLVWWRARKGQGSGLLLSAAVVGAIPLSLQLYVLVLQYTPGLRFLNLSMPWFGRVERMSVLWGWVFAPLALLLLGFGLWRSRLVWRWVAVLAIVSAILVAVSAGWPHEVGTGIITTVSDLQDAAFVPAVIGEIAFLWGAAVSLVAGVVGSPRVAVEPRHRADGAR